MYNNSVDSIINLAIYIEYFIIYAFIQMAQVTNLVNIFYY